MSLEASVRVGSIYKNEVNLTLTFSVWFSLSLFWSERTVFMAVNQLDHTSPHYTAHVCSIHLHLSEQSWQTNCSPSFTQDTKSMYFVFITSNTTEDFSLCCTSLVLKLGNQGDGGVIEFRVNSSHNIQGKQADKIQSKKNTFWVSHHSRVICRSVLRVVNSTPGSVCALWCVIGQRILCLQFWGYCTGICECVKVFSNISVDFLFNFLYRVCFCCCCCNYKVFFFTLDLWCWLKRKVTNETCWDLKWETQQSDSW